MKGTHCDACKRLCPGCPCNTCAKDNFTFDETDDICCFKKRRSEGLGCPLSETECPDWEAEE